MSGCAGYKQRLIGRVENNALYAELWIITQWVITADLKPPPTHPTIKNITNYTTKRKTKKLKIQ